MSLLFAGLVEDVEALHTVRANVTDDFDHHINVGDTIEVHAWELPNGALTEALLVLNKGEGVVRTLEGAVLAGKLIEGDGQRILVIEATQGVRRIVIPSDEEMAEDVEGVPDAEDDAA